jgi:16S rRNA (guanine527-N7)-methyltransferase
VSAGPDRAVLTRLRRRLEEAGIDLDEAVELALVAFVEELLAEPQNLTAIREPEEAVDRHLADSLAALAVPEVATASTLIDLGSGGGFPGIPLAAALPGADVTLVESEGRKASWLERNRARCPNLSVVADRSEHLAARCRERWDVATARAVAPAPVALELAAPLVRPGGHVVLWRTRDDDPDDARAAAEALGLAPARRVAVEPFPGARRALDVHAKIASTPSRYPRRAGIAAKRPLGDGA